MHFHAILTTNPTLPDSVIQASAVPGLLHIIAPRGNRLKCSVEERRNHEPKSSKKSQRNPYSRMKDISLLSHIALTREINVCIPSFPFLLIAYESIPQSAQISQYYQET